MKRKIIYNVIKQLNNEIMPENMAATKIVTKSYYKCRTVMLRRKVSLHFKSKQEKNLRLSIVKWQKENTLQMISDGKAEQSIGQHYINVLN